MSLGIMYKACMTLTDRQVILYVRNNKLFCHTNGFDVALANGGWTNIETFRTILFVLYLHFITMR